MPGAEWALKNRPLVTTSHRRGQAGLVLPCNQEFFTHLGWGCRTPQGTAESCFGMGVAGILWDHPRNQLREQLMFLQSQPVSGLIAVEQTAVWMRGPGP